eukprot:TRINITY_DN9729_c0_g1_i1.p1 TRINITY_DN9729_c0_g1~~TRINITY_DN9729_c0_g1_i1.p1  ORF type:complete len:442 (-),score=58.75 TRINITY_DN9729_c0_g1_i1:178-1503(-)
MFHLANKWFGSSTAKWALFLQLTNWFTFYTLIRTYSNSIETTLVVVGLFYWPTHRGRYSWESRWVALVFAFVSFLIRPTAAIFWIWIGWREIFLFWKNNGNSFRKELYLLIKEVTIIGIVTFGVSVLIDSLWYAKFVIVQSNFLQFNVVSGGANQYGTHPWHWYFSQALPIQLGPYLPIFVAGILTTKPTIMYYKELTVAVWYICVLSLMSHKELRFILPVFPIFLIYCGNFVSSCLHKSDLQQTPSPSQFLRETGKIKPNPAGQTPKQKTIIWIVFFLLFLNVLMGVYFGRWHQRGGMDAIHYIQQDTLATRVDFLMPCHSTPFYSHVHRPIDMDFISCPPSFTSTVQKKMEQEEFYDAMDGNTLSEFLSSRYLNNTRTRDPSNDYPARGFPTHVVTFDIFLPFLDAFFSKFGFKQQTSFFHTHFPESKVGRNVIILKRF